jgi:hypothetical protein
MGVMGCDEADGNQWFKGVFTPDATPSSMQVHVASCLTVQTTPLQLIPEHWDRAMLAASSGGGWERRHRAGRQPWGADEWSFFLRSWRACRFPFGAGQRRRTAAPELLRTLTGRESSMEAQERNARCGNLRVSKTIDPSSPFSSLSGGVRLVESCGMAHDWLRAA